MTENMSSIVVPPGFVLLPGEELREAYKVNEIEPAKYPSAIEWVKQLSQVEQTSKIGDAGPIIASLSLTEKRPSDYEAVYGRDSLRSALTLLPYYPNLAKETLLNLAGSQGVEENVHREEEVGRIVHEDRDPKVDPKAREVTKERGWEWPYYGTVDATPEFIRTYAAYCRTVPYGDALLAVHYQARDGRDRVMADALSSAVDWVTRRMGENADGLLESKRAFPGGTEYEFWRDSWDGYSHADGTLANPDRGVSSIEAQRHVYDALLDVALIYKTSLINRPTDAEELASMAETVRQKIFDIYWTDERGGYFILGTDRDEQMNLRKLMIKTSNMGHTLHSRLLEGDDQDIVDKREAVIGQLFSPEMLCVNGVRTLATSEVRFRPGAFHNGSVWIWENDLIVQGLDQHGYYGLARFLEGLLLNDINATRRLPEYLRGDNDVEHRINTWEIDVDDTINKRLNRAEQPPQDIQAWSAAAILAIKIRRQKALKTAQDEHKLAFEREILAQVSFKPIA